MARRALTASQVNALDKHGVHWIAPSLYMQIRLHGTRSWLFRYGRNGEIALASLSDQQLNDLAVTRYDLFASTSRR